MKHPSEVNPDVQGVRPILYYVFLTQQEARSPKHVIEKFEAQGWTFLKRCISHTSQKIGLVFQRPSVKWGKHHHTSSSHPFQVHPPN